MFDVWKRIFFIRLQLVFQLQIFPHPVKLVRDPTAQSTWSKYKYLTQWRAYVFDEGQNFFGATTAGRKKVSQEIETNLQNNTDMWFLQSAGRTKGIRGPHAARGPHFAHHWPKDTETKLWYSSRAFFMQAKCCSVSSISHCGTQTGVDLAISKLHTQT